MHTSVRIHIIIESVFFCSICALGDADKYARLFGKTLDAPKDCAYKAQKRFFFCAKKKKKLETIYTLTPSLGALQIVNLSSHYTVKCI